MLEVTVGQMSDNNFSYIWQDCFIFVLPKFQKRFTHCFNTKQICQHALYLPKAITVIPDAANDQTCASSAKDLQLLVENYARMNLPAVICAGTYVKLCCTCAIVCTFVA